MAVIPAARRARLAAALTAAEEKKAEDPVLLDLRDLTGITDFFLICSGSSARQVEAIVEEIERALRKLRYRADHREGSGATGWVLLDYLDLVVHVFSPERREFYSLERLWADAPRLDLTSPSRIATAAPRRRRRN